MISLQGLYHRLPLGVRELLAYGLASAAALSVDAALMVVLIDLGAHYLVATAVGFCAGIAVAYGLSVSMVFRHRAIADRRREFAGFLAVGMIGLVLTQLLMAFWVSLIGLEPPVAKLPTAGLVFVFNFVARRTLLFSRPAPRP
ncbi:MULTISPECIES: GtrA family protein [unclassified Caulobacter]|uniref:GtrA family protein n=1 Tax=unclassified Caulobacter TaxID=2648921 RepID=UPI000D3D10AF|nr:MULTISPECIES: GtrA family protein [unclassified Caulobacter]PTS90321.1 GtrA family protein [Caulobacter sp. HMWF009]PTT11487.1 GtrA family protein [Caulobacter sp. HMWF025]